MTARRRSSRGDQQPGLGKLCKLSHWRRWLSRFTRNTKKKKKKEEGNALFNDALNTFLLTVTWHRIYGKEPLKQQEREKRERKLDAAATTWATLFD